MLRKIAEMGSGKIRRKELNKKIDRGDSFVLVDARSAPSYKDEHLPGAISLPLEEVDEKAERVLSEDDEIVVYCSSFSCTASRNEVERLKEMGFKNVKHYAGGIKDCKKAGYPTERS